MTHRLFLNSFLSPSATKYLLVLLFGSLLTLAACGDGQDPDKASDAPETTPKSSSPAAVAADAPSPFHQEARDHLHRGKLDDARLALENALLVNPRDAYSHTLLATIFLLLENPGNAVRHSVDALYDESQDCMLAMGLATGRRRVGINSGAEAVHRDILSFSVCPPDAYLLSALRLGNIADASIAEGRLPSYETPTDPGRTLRLVTLLPSGPDVPDLAYVINEQHGGKITALADRYANIGPSSRVDVHWIADHLALIDARTSEDNLGKLSAMVDDILDEWEHREGVAVRFPAWRVPGWDEFEDEEKRFAMEIPKGWYANAISSDEKIHFSISPEWITSSGSEAVRTGQSPAFSLVLRKLTAEDPPPWNDEYVYKLAAEVSGYFAAADHATEPIIEIVGDEPGQLPGVFVRRTFVLGKNVFRLAAAEVTDGVYLYRLAFAGPADRFDLIEDDFWHLTKSLSKGK